MTNTQGVAAFLFLIAFLWAAVYDITAKLARIIELLERDRD